MTILWQIHSRKNGVFGSKYKLILKKCNKNRTFGNPVQSYEYLIEIVIPVRDSLFRENYQAIQSRMQLI